MATTIPGELLTTAARLGDAPAYSTRVDGTWVPVTWRGYAEEVHVAARALVGVGVEPGDRVAILGWNCPAWTILHVAAMTVGAVPLGIYPTSSTEGCEFALGHSGAVLLLVQNGEQWNKIARIRHLTPALRTVVTMPGSEAIGDDGVLSWEEFQAGAEGIGGHQVQDRLSRILPGDVATMIYTSGTTGRPKVVMLSHDNLVWTARASVEHLGVTRHDSVLSYLPLCHIAEQLFTVHGPAVSGLHVHYVDNIGRLATYLREVRPTVFFAVPRVWEKFQLRIRDELDAVKGLRAFAAQRAMEVARSVHRARNRGEKPGLLTRAQHGIFAPAVLETMKRAIGFDRTRLAISGAAPAAPELLEFFTGLDLPVIEEYGQSENTGICTINVEGATKVGTTGRLLPGVDMALAEDGEILVRGRNVFLGYFDDDESTKTDLRDGWLHTGDLGELDDEGFLKITGRKKDIIITAAGKNVTPALIEGKLTSLPLVSGAVVIGDRQRYLTALLTVDPDAASRHGDGDGIARQVDEHVAEVNSTLARVERIKRYTILPGPFRIEAGELTPTLKIRRRVIMENYAAEIAAMYAD